MSETDDAKRKRLIFRSWHRGTREMDLILGGFAQTYVPSFNAEQLARYDALLQENDPDVFDWISGKIAVPERIKCDVIELLLAHFKGL